MKKQKLPLLLVVPLLLLATFSFLECVVRSDTNDGEESSCTDDDTATSLVSTNHSEYSYSPKGLLNSYKRLLANEKEYLTGYVDSDARSTASPSTSSEKKQSLVVVMAATQITGAGLPPNDVMGYCQRAEQAILMAVQRGANIVLLPELWSGPYFCQSQEAELMQLAAPVSDNIFVKRMQQLAKLYGVVLPVSIYERENNAYYNSIVVVDTDGTILGKYRKSHVPDGSGYQEKFYFSPGDTGFQVFRSTQLGINIGVAICWDQWFPEAARSMALMGADVILYPTAIGSEPHDSTINSSMHWQRVMQGHAASNMVPVVASNRYGTEILLHDDDDDDDNNNNSTKEKQRIHFYGKSFITDNTGEIIAECIDNDTTNANANNNNQTAVAGVVVVTATIDAEANRQERAAWGLYRDRRPDLYGTLLTKDGRRRT